MMWIGTAGCIDGEAEGGEADGGDEALSEVESELTTPQLRGTWDYLYAGGPFGLSLDIVQGSACAPHRERSHYTVERTNGAGRCEARGWYSNDPADCRVWVHVGANWNESGRCTTRVWEWPANVVIYVDHDYGGGSKRFDPGTYDLAQLGIPNDALTSIKVPPGWTAQLFQHGNFNIGQPGWILTLTKSSKHIGSDYGAQYNDNTSSLIVTKLPGAPN